MNILICNVHSLRNSGDAAILYATLALLDRQFPGARVVVSTNDRTHTREQLTDRVVVGTLQSLALARDAAGTYRLRGTLARLWALLTVLFAAICWRATGHLPVWLLDAERAEVLRELTQADLVLASGGGYFYTSAAGDGHAGTFVFTLLAAAIARVCGRPLVLLPQSLGPLHDRLQEAQLRFIIRHAALVCVREQISLDLLQRLGCAERALLVPDLAFGAHPAAEAQAQAYLAQAGVSRTPGRRLVGLTALNWVGQQHTFAGQAPYEAALVALIDHVTAVGDTVVCFPQCIGPGANEDDRRIHARLRDHARNPERVVVIDTQPPPDVLQAAFAQMDAFVGTRLHSVILALTVGVPTLTIGYLHKSRGVLATLGSATPLLDIASVTPGELVAAYDALIAGGAPPPLDHARIARAHAAMMQLIASIR